MKPRDLKPRRKGWWCALCCQWSGQYARHEAIRRAVGAEVLPGDESVGTALTNAHRPSAVPRG